MRVRRDKKFTASICLSLIATIVLLFVVGNLGDIRTYDRPGEFSSLKLFLAQSFMVLTLAGTIVYLFLQFFILNKAKLASLIISSIFGVFFAYNSVFIRSNNKAYVADTYIYLGDYLRDVQGINWYYMDWGGWAITMLLYFTVIYTWAFFIVLDRLFRKLVFSKLEA